MLSLDVHIGGVDAANTVPVIVDLGEVLPLGLNIGNYTLHHVENGATVAMTKVDAVEALDAHNEFYYDPATGRIVVAMATFSEVAMVADTENAWEGKLDYTWYDASKTELVIANADQLAAFGAIVGGMKKVTDRADNKYTYSDEIIQDSFSGKTVKLISDINLGDKESENNPDIIFYPIGYNSSDGKYEKTGVAVTTGFYNFCGTFDGNGHTVSNFYQNTWEMKGDNTYYDLSLQYFRDGMGLFGRVYGGTIKNLTVKNFSSDGEYTTTGVIAAYADGATFENIAIFNCNPRVYNIGNGGIVGCVGWYAKDAGLTTTFKNVTVDNSNKISALWGSYDVACGGIVGQYYPTSGQTSANKPANGGISFENCHIAAQMDVYNDVCGNYQYYAYRYAGMLIGSVRENVTIDGHVYPKMDDITAKDCTVHFGTWNDYYYCEFEKNGHPSYSGPDDYKFSRIPHSEINFTDSNGNGIIDTEGERASVTGCKHEHTAAENNQAIRLPFNNLVTGYGWGVTTKVVGDLGGVTILDREEGNSYVKFEKADTAKDSYTAKSTVTIGELFKAATISDTKLPIMADKVQVTISPAGEASYAGGVYTADTKEWTKGTLQFFGKGAATITITDYYFCTATTIEVNVVDSGILYRVGNDGNVTKAQIAKMLIGNENANITKIEKHDDTSVEVITSGDDVNFNNTGIVKVTIDNRDYYLEVVDATNVTRNTDAKDKNIVLLNDISDGFTVSNGYAVYGNGFTVTCSGDGSYRSAAVSYGFITVENGGILDNVQVICDIFPESYLYTTEMKAGSDGRYPYGYSAVVVSGNSTISNCYIYGARNNIQVGEGNITIENTVLESGSLSNIHIKSNDSYTVTLKDLTTIQYLTTSRYDTTKKVMGFGVLVGTNDLASETNPTIILEGDLKQYNWVNSSEHSNISNSYAQVAIREALKVSKYQHTVDGKTTVNMGIAYMNTENATITDDRTPKTIPYELNEISMGGYEGKVYSIVGSSITAESRYDAETDGVIPYTPTANRRVRPSVALNNDMKALKLCWEFENGEWVIEFSADLDNITGGSYDFKFSDLLVQKYGKNLNFTVKDATGAKVEKNTAITLNQLCKEQYTLQVIDDQIYNNAGLSTGDAVATNVAFVLSATKTSIEPPKFTNAGTATAIRLVDKKGGDWRPAYTVLTGVTVTYWSASEGKVKTVDISTLYNQGTISSNVWTYTCDDYTLTITGGQVHSDGTKITPVVSNNTLYFASTNKAFTTDTTNRNIILTYVFTDKNDSTTWNRTENVQYSNLSEYDYSKFKNGTLEEPSSGSSPCVTPDTLITLADGSQVRVDSLKGDEMLLVWNLETGKYDTAPIVFVDNDAEQEFEIIHLYFSDGSDVKVIYEHGFFDLDLGKYVYIDATNYADYVGHRFVTEGDIKSNSWKVATLDEVVIEKEVTTAWSPVTFAHLCYFTNGVLSMPGGIAGLFNIFEVDTATMRYDMDKMIRDIETYGLFTIEDFGGMITEEAFYAFNGAYLKVAIGKGLLTWEAIAYMAERYIPLM